MINTLSKLIAISLFALATAPLQAKKLGIELPKLPDAKEAISSIKGFWDEGVEAVKDEIKEIQDDDEPTSNPKATTPEKQNKAERPKDTATKPLSPAKATKAEIPFRYERTWHPKGSTKTVVGTLQAINGDSITLLIPAKDKNGKADPKLPTQKTTVTRATLGEADELYLQSIEKRIQKPSQNIKISLAKKFQARFYYETEHFFIITPKKLSPALQQEFAQILEGAYAQVRELIGENRINKAPNDRGLENKFVCRVYHINKDYLDEVRAANTANNMNDNIKDTLLGSDDCTYSIASRRLYVNMDKIGEIKDKEADILEPKNNEVLAKLAHEVVYQLIFSHRHPSWITEALADYIGGSYYSGYGYMPSDIHNALATISSKTNYAYSTNLGTDINPPNVGRLLEMGKKEFYKDLERRRASAELLLIYLIHIDPKAQRGDIRDFFTTLHDSNLVDANKALLKKRTPSKLGKEINEAYKQYGMNVKF